MAIIDLNKNPTERELRWFGLMLPIFAILLGTLLWRPDAPQWAILVWAFGATLSAIYFTLKASRRRIYVGWMLAAYPIGWTVSHLLLGAIYYLIVTPIGMILRLTGYDPLQRRFDRSAATYWTPHDPGGDVSRYFKQF
jgi:hypothetical protein